MFAVVKTGGKQYKVAEGDTLLVEKLQASKGDLVQFNEVLAVNGTSIEIGTPLVSGAAVKAEIVDQAKGKKTIHFVKRRRKHSSQRKKGHRQNITVIKVTEIIEKGSSAQTANFVVLESNPAAKTAKPAAKKTKPAAKTAKPETKTAKPAAKTAKPAAKTAKPAAKTAKPAASES